MPPVRFTKKQTAHCKAIVAEFLRLSNERPGSLPYHFHLHLKLLHVMIEDGLPFDDHDFQLLALLLQLYLEVADWDEVDPLAEQAYVKCSGHWLEDRPPWYDRIAAQNSDAQVPPLGT